MKKANGQYFPEEVLILSNPKNSHFDFGYLGRLIYFSLYMNA